jgi:hypothetical protein
VNAPSIESDARKLLSDANFNKSGMNINIVNDMADDKNIKVNDSIVLEREKLIKFIKNCKPLQHLY